MPSRHGRLSNFKAEALAGADDEDVGRVRLLDARTRGEPR